MPGTSHCSRCLILSATEPGRYHQSPVQEGMVSRQTRSPVLELQGPGWLRRIPVAVACTVAGHQPCVDMQFSRPFCRVGGGGSPGGGKSRGCAASRWQFQDEPEAHAHTADPQAGWVWRRLVHTCGGNSYPAPHLPFVVQLVPLTTQPLQHFLEDDVRSRVVRGLLRPLPGPMGHVLPAGPAEQTSGAS